MIITKYKVIIENMRIDFLSMEEAEAYQKENGGEIIIVDEEIIELEQIIEE